MEVGVRLLGIFLRLLNALLTPVYWLLTRGPSPRLPPLAPVHSRGAADLARAIRTGEFTSEELVSAYIQRVKDVNPLLNAVVEDRFEAAMAEARAIDLQIQEAKTQGTHEELFKEKPLLGVPFSVKESCSLAGLSNSCGVLESAGRRALADGGAVRRVRGAGAVALLVSNTPELCLGWETANLLRGATGNPYCLRRTPGGSSGGEGALIASGASVFGVASDIAGSIRVPAAFCGIYGHKPTPGIVPIDGHIPTLNDEIFPKFLTIGPMARKAEDLPLLMEVMAGDNKHKLRLDEPVDMSKLKVFYMTEASNSLALIPVDKDIKELIKSCAEYLKTECGATVSEEKFLELEDSVEMSVSVFFSMKDIPNMLADPANPKRDKMFLVEVVKTLLGAGARSLQALGFALIARTQLFIPQARRQHYQDKAEKLAQRMQRTLGTHGVLLYPVSPGGAHAHGAVFSRAAGVLYSMALNVLRMPATAAPLPPHPRTLLPRAVQVIAAPGQDRLCLAVARQLEIGFGGWRPPC